MVPFGFEKIKKEQIPKEPITRKKKKKKMKNEKQRKLVHISIVKETLKAKLKSIPLSVAS